PPPPRQLTLMTSSPSMPRFGLGFRTQHFAELAQQPRAVDWLELLSDNYLGVGGPRRAQLEALRRDHVVALHGVGLGIANDAPPSVEYLAALRELADFAEPGFVSDHLCWTGIRGRNSHDLLPIARTREALALVSERVARAQDVLGRRLLLENASVYVAFRADEMSEGELFAELCARTGCGVLLDVNNLFVNAANLGADPREMLGALREQDVAYFHVAGHTALPDVRIDTHGADVPGDVWALFREAARRFPRAHVILERDDAIPPLAALLRELDQARAIWREANDAQHAEPARERAASVPRQAAAASARAAASWGELQAGFWQRCIGEPAGPDVAPRAGLDELFDAQRPVAATRGLRVYRDAYRENLRAALAANFPRLSRALRPRDFAALADAYAAAHPPTSQGYVCYGAQLAEFIERFPFAGVLEIPAGALADLARLEQAQLEVQEAPDCARGIAAGALAEIPPAAWPETRFSFAPAFRVVEASRERRTHLVARVDGKVVSEPLDARGGAALAALARGSSFSQACELVGGEGAVEPAIQALLRACALGVVTALK
ncbi:MAG TPA: DUF692 family protein, partial [Myxococcota bacterium]|nr:DUF692 family protein [Myxococcota bacterium]